MSQRKKARELPELTSKTDSNPVVNLKSVTESLQAKIVELHTRLSNEETFSSSKEAADLIRSVNVLFLCLKKTNRDTQLFVNSSREQVAKAKAALDQRYLEHQNLEYEKFNLERELQTFDSGSTTPVPM